MIPKIKFNYVPTYDNQWSKALNKAYDFEGNKREARKFLQELKNHWTESKESKALELISKYSGLEWGEKEIDIYVVKNLNIMAFSRPFTIKMGDDYLLSCEVLIHELIHTILNQNFKKFKDVIENLRKSFPREDINVIVHLIVISIEKKILDNIFNKEEISYIMDKTKNIKGFKNVYEIIENNFKNLDGNIMDSLLKWDKIFN